MLIQSSNSHSPSATIALLNERLPEEQRLGADALLAVERRLVHAHLWHALDSEPAVAALWRRISRMPQMIEFAKTDLSKEAELLKATRGDLTLTVTRTLSP